MAASTFVRLVDADWSTNPGKRWAAEALRTTNGWSVTAPRLVGPTDRFVADLLQGPQPTLAGFDFPIGLPAAFGERTGFATFTEAVAQFGSGAWARFYDVAERPEEISVHRPFYPRVPAPGTRPSHLLAALGVDDIHGLRRQCERATRDRRAACSLFWTLGGSQVGKAAIAGWRKIVQPARAAGAALWPFEGDLGSLAGTGRLVLCETYPAEAYRHVGVVLGAHRSKRRHTDRIDAARGLAARCKAHGISLDAGTEHLVADGFGLRRDGEDLFDATVGLLGMIEVVAGRRPAAPAHTEAPEWEGWMLGQAE